MITILGVILVCWTAIVASAGFIYVNVLLWEALQDWRFNRKFWKKGKL